MSPTGNNASNIRKDNEPKKKKEAPIEIEVKDSKIIKGDKNPEKVKKEKKKEIKEKPLSPKEVRKKLAAKVDLNIVKAIKNAVYSKVCPPQHFHGNGIEVQMELATEAGRHLLSKGQWAVESLTDSKGNITHVITEVKK